MSKNKTFIDPLFPFGQELYKHAQSSRYLSIKRKGSLIRAVLWNHEFFNGVHKIRTDYQKSKKGEKATSSLNRARQTVFDLVEVNLHEWGEKPVFVTYTYAENRDLSLDEAIEDFTNSIRKLKYLSSIKPMYVCVPEFQKDGTPHFHIVFFNLPFIYVSDQARHKTKKKSVFDFTWKDVWMHGDVNIKKIRNEYRTNSGKEIKNGCAAYMSKYLSKEFQDQRLYGKRTYYASRGLIRPYSMFLPLCHDTYFDLPVKLHGLFGIDEEVQTTFYNPIGDYVIIEGKDNKGNNLAKKFSGKKIK